MDQDPASFSASNDEDVKPAIHSEWPAANKYDTSAQLVYTAAGGINLRDQSYSMRGSLRSTMKLVEGDLMFVTAFPDNETKIKFNRDALFMAATDSLALDIASRAAEDPMFLTIVSKKIVSSFLYQNFQ